ncbi:hypothetical protein QZG57_04250 [Corynebacterium glucuronolyticum]|uniref:DUF6542 domain-containing protein n=1 Tax=Corynebacterium glucuronolyticum TaxID=39791 RepID=UPI003F6DF9BC
MSDQPLQNNRRPASNPGERRHQPSASHRVDASSVSAGQADDNEPRGRQKYSFTPTASARVSNKWDYPTTTTKRSPLPQPGSGTPDRDRSTQNRRRRHTHATPSTDAATTATKVSRSARPRPPRRAEVGGHESIHGIPLWAVPLLLIAALLTGAVISMAGGTLGWIYLFSFGLISLCIALFVEPRGIFLAVAQIPLVFSIVTPFAGWLVAQTHSDNNFSATVLIGAAYPLFQQFPFLLIITAGAAAIGYLRLAQLRRAERGEVRQREETSRRQRSSDEKNRQVAQRARRISTSTSAPRSKGRARTTGHSGSTVTVQDLLRRQAKGGSTHHSSANRSVDDDLYQ